MSDLSNVSTDGDLHRPLRWVMAAAYVLMIQGFVGMVLIFCAVLGAVVVERGSLPDALRASGPLATFSAVLAIPLRRVGMLQRVGWFFVVVGVAASVVGVIVGAPYYFPAVFGFDAALLGAVLVSRQKTRRSSAAG